jgi:hypothetical protein
LIRFPAKNGKKICRERQVEVDKVFSQNTNQSDQEILTRSTTFLFFPKHSCPSAAPYRDTFKMKLFIAAAILSTASAFAPGRQASFTIRLQSAVEADVPERTAPDAGHTPEWEDRAGLTPSEFMASDESKSDISGMWECPLTRWDSEE